jgi:hypothetical protein
LARKRKSKPSGKKRTERQNTKDRYAHARDDAQRLGLIETTPEEALESEVVDPETQGSQPLPGLVGRAIRKGWEPPEDVKIDSVDELARLIRAPDEKVYPHIKVMAVRVLQQGDQIEWERANPELAGKVRGGVKVDVHNQNNVQVNMLDGARAVLIKPDPLEEAKRRIQDERTKQGDGQVGGVKEASRGEPDQAGTQEDHGGGGS